MIYLDASALVKLARDELESPDLRVWLHDTTSWLISSAVAEVELSRALRRALPADEVAAGAAVLESVDLVELHAEVRALAASVGTVDLRALDAIHVASALSVAGGVDALVTYDRRLAAAARAEGLTVVAPGASPPV